MKLGISGVLTRTFINSPLTPLFLLISVVLGIMALMALPREEDPQISVPLVDVIVSADGLKAADVVELVTKPLETIVQGIDDVEHVYSLSEDDQVIVTVRFFAGTDEDRATFRVHEEVNANLDRLPTGIPVPKIVGRGINDVPIVTITLTPKPDASDEWTDNALYDIAEELLHEISTVEDVGLTFLVGGRADQIRIEPDPERLSLYGVTLNQVVRKVQNANRSFGVGNLREAGKTLPVVAGQTVKGPSDIGLLNITARDGRPVYLKDVANIVVGAAPEEARVWHFGKTGEKGELSERPAVTLAIAKRQGSNAVIVAENILKKVELVRGGLVPDSLDAIVTRDYGVTAGEKSDELMFHLIGATVVIVLMIAIFFGWREGIVVLVIVPTTILMTFFAAWILGYTINRVSLFALILSIGILVDDAIVVVENIVRHWGMRDGRDRITAAIEAVAEVGNPTLVATLTIIAALLPMMFVSGLMGPYMSPIPANASAAMAFSFVVAVVITPWLLVRMQGKQKHEEPAHEETGDTALGRMYRRFAGPVLKSKRNSWVFLISVFVGTVVVSVLFATKDVTVKLLPFDNKSEIQVVMDLPEGASLEATERNLAMVAHALGDLPELSHIQSYAGTAAPFNFNGLVRHYDIRRKPWQGDLQINLTPKHERDRQSHEIALQIRKRIEAMEFPAGTTVKVVEVPPGPPVISTLMAEIYGPDQKTRRQLAWKVREAFENVDYIVDIDDSIGLTPERLRFEVDQGNLEFHGVHEQELFDTLKVLLNGTSIGYSHRGDGTNPVEIAIRLPKKSLFLGEHLLATPVEAPGEAADKGAVVEIGDIVRLKRELASYPIFRHNGRFAEVVYGELAGRFEAPIYGMFDVNDELAKMNWGAEGAPTIAYHGQPTDLKQATVLWDGEWEVTYVTFRDMGLAFAFALIAVYILIVGQFSNFRVPLVIMTPIPLSLIGIVIGHLIFDAPFTATSMIGFIALAGILVRNSILLVDFIRHRMAEGEALRDALLQAGAIRLRPILLTAVAAMIGAAFILTDPIFQGLAISMVFGLASSTALTLLVIPAVYVVLRDDGHPAKTPAGMK